MGSTLRAGNSEALLSGATDTMPLRKNHTKDDKDSALQQFTGRQNVEEC